MYRSADTEQAQVSQARGNRECLKGIHVGFVQIVVVPDETFGMIVIQTGGSEMEIDKDIKSESNLS